MSEENVFKKGDLVKRSGEINFYEHHYLECFSVKVDENTVWKIKNVNTYSEYCTSIVIQPVSGYTLLGDNNEEFLRGTVHWDAEYFKKALPEKIVVDGEEYN